MGYGSRALHLLKQYYEFKIPCLKENETVQKRIKSVDSNTVDLLEECIKPRNKLSPLLFKLSERPPEHLDYLGVCFGLTENLLKFWKKAGYVPVYLRQTTNDLTGEHSCIMLHILNTSNTSSYKENEWLKAYWTDFRKRFINLLAYQFKTFHPSLALGLLTNKSVKFTRKGKKIIFYNIQGVTLNGDLIYIEEGRVCFLKFHKNKFFSYCSTG